MNIAELESALKEGMSKRTGDAVERLNDLATDMRGAWKNLTLAQQRALASLARGKRLWVGRDPGDDCHPATARRLVERGLAVTVGLNEFSEEGPYVKLCLNEYRDGLPR